MCNIPILTNWSFCSCWKLRNKFIVVYRLITNAQIFKNSTLLYNQLSNKIVLCGEKVREINVENGRRKYQDWQVWQPE
jgi:hypothetical protein